VKSGDSTHFVGDKHLQDKIQDEDRTCNIQPLQYYFAAAFIKALGMHGERCPIVGASPPAFLLCA